MPAFRCPFPNCNFATADISEGLASTMLTIHASGAHAPTPTPAPPTRDAAQQSRAEKVRRPTISAAGTGEDWKYFTARWDEYTAATGIVAREKVLQLLECCDEELRKDLTRNAGCSLANTAEADVLKAIKLLAVRQENVMVAQDKLWQMQQDHDEPIRTFGARIRGQASMCNFNITCSSATCEQVTSFMDQILRGVLVRGVADYEIRLAILQDINQNMSLEQAFQFIEAKEAGKRSASKMLESQEVAATRSRYRQSKFPFKNPADKPPPPQNDICLYCGKSGHGRRETAEVRSKNCPHCSIPHHFEAVKNRGARRPHLVQDTTPKSMPSITLSSHSQTKTHSVPSPHRHLRASIAM